MYLRHSWLPVAIVGVYVALAATAHRLDGAGLPLCVFRLATGVPCPGCGTTRAGLAILTGHFGDALRQNPLTACALILAAPGAAAWLLCRATGRGERRLSLPGGARALALAALGVAIGLNWAYLITCSPSRIGTRPPIWALVRPTHQ